MIINRHEIHDLWVNSITQTPLRIIELFFSVYFTVILSTPTERVSTYTKAEDGFLLIIKLSYFSLVPNDYSIYDISITYCAHFITVAVHLRKMLPTWPHEFTHCHYCLQCHHYRRVVWVLRASQIQYYKLYTYSGVIERLP